MLEVSRGFSGSSFETRVSILKCYAIRDSGFPGFLYDSRSRDRGMRGLSSCFLFFDGGTLGCWGWCHARSSGFRSTGGVRRFRVRGLWVCSLWKGVFFHLWIYGWYDLGLCNTRFPEFFGTSCAGYRVWEEYWGVGSPRGVSAIFFILG